MNWLKKINIMVLTLILLSIPMISYADNDFNVLEDKSFEKKQHYEDANKIKDTPEEVRLKIKELKQKLKKGEITKEQFKDEMKKLFPGKVHFKRRGSYKDLPDDVKVKLQELKKQLLDGKITEDQFHKEIEKIMPPEIKNRE